MRLLAAALLAGALLSGCSSPSPPTATGDATRLDLVDNRYEPASASLKADQAAHFQNKGAVAHTVTVHGPAGTIVHDKTLQPGASDEFRFPGPGSYHVFCRFHDGMAASVTVT